MPEQLHPDLRLLADALDLLGGEPDGSDQVSALREMNVELFRLATTDHLTGLANRRKVEADLTAELHRFSRFGRPVIAGLVDVDGFKAVNDRRGHRAGDQVLVQVADTLERSTRVVDLVGRWGGDEFVVLFPETTEDEAIRLSDDCCVAVTQAVGATISIGATAFAEGDDLDAVVIRMSAALDAAKVRGGDVVVFAGLDE